MRSRFEVRAYKDTVNVQVACLSYKNCSFLRCNNFTLNNRISTWSMTFQYLFGKGVLQLQVTTVHFRRLFPWDKRAWNADDGH